MSEQEKIRIIALDENRVVREALKIFLEEYLQYLHWIIHETP